LIRVDGRPLAHRGFPVLNSAAMRAALCSRLTRSTRTARMYSVTICVRIVPIAGVVFHLVITDFSRCVCDCRCNLRFEEVYLGHRYGQTQRA